MIKNFLIINFTGRNDKIGLKINNDFFIHEFKTKIQNNEILVSTILNLTKKHKVNINEQFSILVNSGPGSFSAIRVALAVAKGIKISKNTKLFGFENKDLPQFNLEKHDFKGGKARYEQSPDEHHDHLIDINSGEIIEFVDKEIEKLQIEVAKKLGYKLVDHKLELYGSKIKK